MMLRDPDRFRGNRIAENLFIRSGFPGSGQDPEAEPPGGKIRWYIKPGEGRGHEPDGQNAFGSVY